MKVAIVGSGIAGLAASEELHKCGHDITVFEANDYIGGHVKTIRVPLDDSGSHPLVVDLGVFMHEPVYLHPKMSAHAQKLGIKTHPFDLSISMVSREHNIRYVGVLDPNRTIAKGLSELLRAALIDARHGYPLSNARFLLAFDKFYKQMPAILSEDRYRDMSLRKFLGESRLSGDLVLGWLLPNLLCWWGVPREQLMNCSLRVIIDSFFNTPRSRQYIFTEGWEQLTNAMARPFLDKIRMLSPVDLVKPEAKGVEVSSLGISENFDAVIMGTPPNRCLEVLKGLSPEEMAVLDKFATSTTTVYLHRDTSWAPPLSERGIVNLVTDERGSYTTLWSGGLDSRKPSVFVTWGDCLQDTIDPSSLISVTHWNRTLPTVDYAKASHQIQAIQGKRRVWYCGAHVHALDDNSPPSLWHENAFISGRQAAQELIKAKLN